MKTLYVHIGAPKTGTTAIRMFCWENREVLKKYGYCYPDLREVSPKGYFGRNGYFLIDGLNDAEISGEKYRQGMDIVIKLFEEYDNVVLSDEHIFRSTYQKRKILWQQLKEDGEKHGFTVKIIVYLRRQDEFIKSFRNQRVKLNVVSAGVKEGIKTWDEFLDTMPASLQLDYYEKLEGMAAVLGKENIIVRRFERGRFWGDSIYADFMHILGLEVTDEYEIAQEERNPQLPGNTQEIIRILNDTAGVDEKDLQFMRSILFTVGETSKAEYPCSMFSKEECEEFLAEYKESNRRVAEEYLGEPGADLFDNTVPDLPKWTADNPYMYRDIIRFAAIGMKKLREENEKQHRENEALRQEMKKFKKDMKEMINHPLHTVGKQLRKKKEKKS